MRGHVQVRRVCAVLVAVALSAGCKSKATERPPERSAAAVVETRTPRVDALLAGLTDPSYEAWRAGSEAMGAAARGGELAPGEVIALLHAVVSLKPLDDDHDAQAVILSKLEGVEGHAAFVPVLDEILLQLRNDSRGEALGLLVRSPGGFDTLVRIAPRYPDQLYKALGYLDAPGHEPPVADRARLLALARTPALVDTIAETALEWSNRAVIDRATLADLGEAFVRGCRAARDRLAAAHVGHPEEIEPAEIAVGVYLDLFHYLPPDVVAGELKAAARDLEPMIAVFAIVSIVRGDGAPEPAAMDAVARHDGARWVLYKMLAAEGRQSVIPDRWRTQEALARADLAHWASFGTELGKVPDEMALMKAIPIDAGAGDMLDLYVFRFRTLPPHWAASKGWIAGVAGPYRRDGGPYLDGPNTFSAFDAADAKTAEEHAGRVEEILATWRKQGR